MIDGRAVKCLVVDDDHDVADVVGDLLTVLGAEVRVVYGAHEALNIAPHFQPRLVVLDINMPSIDGFETCTRLRLQQWAGNAVFIAHTGLPASRVDALAAGFDRLVSKGDSPAVFETILYDLAP